MYFLLIQQRCLELIHHLYVPVSTHYDAVHLWEIQILATGLRFYGTSDFGKLLAHPGTNTLVTHFTQHNIKYKALN